MATSKLEHQVLKQVRAIIGNEEQVIGRRGVLIDLKKDLLAESDIQVIINHVSSDPALAAHLLQRSNTAQNAGVVSTKNRSIKEALIRLGNVNIYRYAFAFYLKERLDSLTQPYKKLVQGYWQVNEKVAGEALAILQHEKEQNDQLRIDADEMQTLALFSLFGDVIALTAFAYVNDEQEKPFSLKIMKTVLEKEQQTLSIEAFTSLGLDNDLKTEFMIAHNLKQTKNPDSAGLILRRVLSKHQLLINPLKL